MKFVAVKEVPNTTKGHRFRLRDRWEEFMKMNVKIAKVDLNENDYSSPKVAYTTMMCSVKRYGYPIDVVTRDGVIYLVRRDM